MNKAIDTRELLIMRGIELFSKSNYEGVSVQEIVSAAGVSKPTLYHYFDSKQHFYEMLYDIVGEPVLEKAKVNTQYQGDLVQNLNQVALDMFKYIDTHDRNYWFLENSLYVSPNVEQRDVVKRFWMKYVSFFVNLFEEAVVQHGNLAGKEAELAFTFLGGLRMLLLLKKTDLHRCSEDMPYRYVKQFMYGIFS